MELQDLINNPNSNIVDVRTSNEFNLENLEGSINIPLDDVVKREEELRSMQPLILCCLSGGRSGQATRYLKSIGFDNVYNGGGWKEVKALKERL